MGSYPIKVLKDEQGTPFVPLVSSDSIQTPDGKTLDDKLQTKLEIDDIQAGQYIKLDEIDDKITINVDLPASANTINNLTTEEAGQGALDAYQGKVLKDSIPVLVDDLESTDANKALTARQGKILNERTVPEGGKAGQVLKKTSDSDHALEWGDAADPNAIVGDGSIMSIVEMTYEEYKTLESQGKIRPDTEYHITNVENGTATYISETDINIMASNKAREQFEQLYPVGSVIYNSNGVNPAEYLKYGTWTQTRTFYGGELLGYGVVTSTSSGSAQSASNHYNFADTSVGSKQYNVVNYLPEVITGQYGALYIKPQNIVGFIESTIYISGHGDGSTVGIWWSSSNGSELPEGVTCLGGSRAPLLTGPIGSNYGGNSCNYFYQVEDGVTEGFYINPQYQPYGGAITPSNGGVGCRLNVKVFAKAGTNYMWERIS